MSTKNECKVSSYFCFMSQQVQQQQYQRIKEEKKCGRRMHGSVGRFVWMWDILCVCSYDVCINDAVYT